MAGPPRGTRCCPRRDGRQAADPVTDRGRAVRFGPGVPRSRQHPARTVLASSTLRTTLRAQSVTDALPPTDGCSGIAPGCCTAIRHTRSVPSTTAPDGARETTHHTPRHDTRPIKWPEKRKTMPFSVRALATLEFVANRVEKPRQAPV